MTAEIIKFGGPTSVDKLLDYIKERQPIELVTILFDGEGYEFHHTEIESISRIIGTLERLKLDLMIQKDYYEND
jgi:hypothetical protein